MGGNKNQHNGRITSGQTATPPSQGGVNVQPVNITRPPKYIVTIGFEVNHIATAFIGETQDLSVDYGHAFFYITRDDEVTVFFSFGPSGGKYSSKPPYKPFQYSGRRPGTTLYPITEVSHLIRLQITEKQATDVKVETEKFTQRVNNGKEHYTAIFNDTCAETARDMLTYGGVDTPSGSGPVKGIGADFVTQRINVVNPYMWHKRLLNQYKGQISYPGPLGYGGLEAPDYIKIEDPNYYWYLESGWPDPLVDTNQTNIIHGIAPVIQSK